MSELDKMCEMTSRSISSVHETDFTPFFGDSFGYGFGLTSGLGEEEDALGMSG